MALTDFPRSGAISAVLYQIYSTAIDKGTYVLYRVTRLQPADFTVPRQDSFTFYSPQQPNAVRCRNFQTLVML